MTNVIVDILGAIVYVVWKRGSKIQPFFSYIADVIFTGIPDLIFYTGEMVSKVAQKIYISFEKRRDKNFNQLYENEEPICRGCFGMANNDCANCNRLKEKKV